MKVRSQYSLLFTLIVHAVVYSVTVNVMDVVML